MDDTRAAAAIVAAGRRLGARGLISAGEGNLSIRLDRDRLLVTPSGRRKDELAAGRPRRRLARSRRRGRDARSPVRARPTSDLAIHLAVHAARPDIGAVAHAHLPAAMAPDAGRRGARSRRPCPETALFIPRLPLVAFGEMGSDELAGADRGGPDRAARSRWPWPCLLERHGAVAVGRGSRPRRSTGSSSSRSCAATWRDALLIQRGRAAVG